MGATRVVMSLAVLGLAGGAYLAFATGPSFAPYINRRAATPVVINGPIAGDRSTSQDTSDSVPGEYGLTAPRQQADEGFSVRPGPQDGTIVLQLPRWAEDTAQWYGFGERALQQWRSWSNSDDRRADDQEGEQAYGPSRQWQRQGPYGGSSAFNERYSSRDDRDDEDGYAEPERWSDEAPAYGPSSRYERRYRNAGPSADAGASPDAGADAAQRAADRARDAARDVRDAERDAQ